MMQQRRHAAKQQGCQLRLMLLQASWELQALYSRTGCLYAVQGSSSSSS
jgi:hypothetical protein